MKERKKERKGSSKITEFIACIMNEPDKNANESGAFVSSNTFYLLTDKYSTYLTIKILTCFILLLIKSRDLEPMKASES